MNIDKSYLVNKTNKRKNTVININGTLIGDGNLVFIAGPCTISNQEKLNTLSQKLKDIGVTILRGGTYKPRTSPYSFQGLEKIGIEYLYNTKKLSGLLVISEITSIEYLDEYLKFIDIIQVGSRNMQNYELLKKLGRTNKPILLKRNMSCTYEEWLMAAEYILKEGNPNVILCERGIRTFESETRNTLDLQAIPVIKKLTHLPIIVDPSHASGKSYIVESMAIAAVAAGADGLIIEVEENPNDAVCDKEQTIDINTMERIITKCIAIKNVLKTIK